MNDFRADRLPNAGFMVEVDGQMKTWFDDKAAAYKAAAELSTRFPMLQVKIYDAVEKTREMMSVPEKSEET